MAEPEEMTPGLLVALDAGLALPPCFESLGVETTRTFIPTLAFFRLAQGEDVVREGEEGDGRFFVLLQGGLSVFKSRGAEAQEVAVFAPGDTFGEISLMASTRRTATIRASEPCLLASMDRRDLEKVIERQPELGDRLEEQARSRLRG